MEPSGAGYGVWGQVFVCINEPTAFMLEGIAKGMDDSVRGTIWASLSRYLYCYDEIENRHKITDATLPRFVIGACCINGELPTSLTEKKGFKLITWPTTTN